MPTVFSHAVAAAALSTVFPRQTLPQHVWAAGAICAMLPDADVVGFHFGVHYGDLFGHRGFTHSLVFAAVIASLGFLVLRRRNVAQSAAFLWLYLFIATASHGVLDAFTNGGLGIAFFAPFLNTRYFFPVTPIEVSPIGVSGFFSSDGLPVLKSEFLWVWLPSAALAIIAMVLWRRAQVNRAPATSR